MNFGASHNKLEDSFNLSKRIKIYILHIKITLPEYYILNNIEKMNENVDAANIRDIYSDVHHGVGGF